MASPTKTLEEQEEKRAVDLLTLTLAAYECLKDGPWSKCKDASTSE